MAQTIFKKEGNRMKPSIKTIETRLRDSLEKHHTDYRSAARAIRHNMDIATTPMLTDFAMDIINDMLHGYGVEAIRDNKWDNGFYHDIGLLYVNMGDTYIDTVIYDTRKGKFFVTSWGNYIENKLNRFNI